VDEDAVPLVEVDVTVPEEAGEALKDSIMVSEVQPVYDL